MKNSESYEKPILLSSSERSRVLVLLEIEYRQAKEFLEANQSFLQLLAEEKLDTPDAVKTTKENIELSQEKIKDIQNLISKFQ